MDNFESNIQIDFEWIYELFAKSNKPMDLYEESRKRGKDFLMENKSQFEDLVSDFWDERRNFNSRLDSAWGDAIFNLKLLYLLSIDFGQAFQGLSKDQRKKDLYAVLLKLHAKGCQITAEIICLLSNGFADGAYTRWRSLHEINVTAAFLKKFYSAELIQRYLDFSIFESFRAFEEYEEHCSKLGYPSHSSEEISENLKMKSCLIERYGKASLRQPYGWANLLFPDRKKVSFSSLEKKVNFAHWRPFYRMASHHVHAQSKGLFFSFGLREDSNVMIAGPSNVGLVDPGQSTAISLCQLTTELLLSQYAGDAELGLDQYPELIYMVSILAECSAKAASKFVEIGEFLNES